MPGFIVSLANGNDISNEWQSSKGTEQQYQCQDNVFKYSYWTIGRTLVTTTKSGASWRLMSFRSDCFRSIPKA